MRQRVHFETACVHPTFNGVAQAQAAQALLQVITQQQQLLAAVAQAAGVGREHSARHNLAQAFRHGLRQRRARQNGPWAWIAWSGHEHKFACFLQY